MSDFPQSPPAGEPAAEAPLAGEVQDADAPLPMLLGASPAAAPGRFSKGLYRDRAAGSIPVVGAAAVAAGSFVAGAAVVGLVHRRQRHPAALGGRRAGRALGRGGTRKAGNGPEVMKIVSSSTFLVDVHRLGIPGSDG